MESIKFTITDGQFNTQESKGIITDVSKQIPWDNNREYYPQDLTIVNNTSATIGVLYLTEEERDNRFNKYPTFYIHTELLGDSIVELPINTKYIIFKLLSGNATGNLDFYCRNYTK